MQHQYTKANSPTLPSIESKRWKKGWKALLKNKYLILMALPGLIYFALFKYVPMWGIVIAFQNYSPYAGWLHSEWVGLDHFQRFFSNPEFYFNDISW